ncbi:MULTISPECIES: hypothetical protein [Pseudomonadaceae]|jgi:putative alpha-1,2-mannosidase|uniref:hypothetical protein n=1 Tax=Pseudomonadaceae TaxID=135621 RepID=UPI000AB1F212|nr:MULTISPECIES: hypothetical protein [Pseudomonadaceae]MCF6753487.1 hypothetical protein [Stutzerimonas stutzeri]MDT3708593.1 hypothetical protein [Pseudomonadaceae bacterium]MCQ4274791.1 hypothetical protein [Stutzerimonas degradans]QPT20344.1 hypothetical protein I6G33_11710 [Stutzerimonas degradans]UIP86519.1 hypothetical protein HU825_08190 [Pseudomonas phenolilytica]
MNILVRPLTPRRDGAWQVRLDRHPVTFRNEAEARAFVNTLQRRLTAPHSLPVRASV